MTYVDVGLCMFVSLVGTGEVLIGFELLHSKFRADLPAIHMWPVPEDALPAIGIVTRQRPPKSKAQNDGDSNFDNFVLLQEEFDPKRHFSKLKKATLHFTLHLVMLEACGGLFCGLFMALLYLKNHVGHTSYVPPEVWSQRPNLQRSYRGSTGQRSSGLVTVGL